MLTTVAGYKPDAGEYAFIDQVIARRCARPGALLGVLEEIQENNPRKFLCRDVIRYTADKTELPQSQIFSVVTFYAFFNRELQGEHIHERTLARELEALAKVEDLSGFRAGRERGLAKLLPAVPRITAGVSTCGRGSGAEGVHQPLAQDIDRAGLDIYLAGAGCFGPRSEEPLVSIRLRGGPLLFLRRVQATFVPRILAATGEGEIPQDLGAVRSPDRCQGDRTGESSEAPVLRRQCLSGSVRSPRISVRQSRPRLRRV